MFNSLVKKISLSMLVLSLSACGGGGGGGNSEVAINKPVLDNEKGYLPLSLAHYEVISNPIGFNMPHYLRNENPSDMVSDNQPDETKKDWAFFVRHMGSNATSVSYNPLETTLATTGKLAVFELIN